MSVALAGNNNPAHAPTPGGDLFVQLTGFSMMLKCFRRRTSISTAVRATRQNCSVTGGAVAEALLPPLKYVRTPDSPKYSPLSSTVSTFRAACSFARAETVGVGEDAKYCTDMRLGAASVWPIHRAERLPKTKNNNHDTRGSGLKTN